MRAAVLRAFGEPLAIERRAYPEPDGDAVVVRVAACGVCHSDLEAIDGHWPDFPLPRVLGHEIAGDAGELGPVLVYGAWGCGACDFCERGEEQLCPRHVSAGHHRDGGYADAVLVPSARHLFPLDGLDPVRATPLTDAALTSYRAVRRVLPWTAPGAVAIVVGAGGLGQFAVQWLKLLGESRVVVVDPAEGKRRRALELGADEATATAEDLRPARAIVDFVGSADTMRLAAAAIEPSGVVMSVGGGGGRLAFGLGAVPYESVFTTSAWGSRFELAEVLTHARRGDLEWEVEALPLDRINDALAALRAGQVPGRLAITP
jgi:alcohol dehydrogenase, propanol-preferring